MKKNSKELIKIKAIKRAAVPCLVYWGILTAMLLFLNAATEQWMILAIFALLISRLMLWLSPFALSAMCWISGGRKPSCRFKDMILANVLVLILNILPFCLWHLISGNWY